MSVPIAPEPVDAVFASNDNYAALTLAGRVLEASVFLRISR